VSAGLTEALLLVVVASVLSNRILARPARRSGGLLLRLHRAHSVTLVLGFALLASLLFWLIASVVPSVTLMTAFLSIGMLLALQFLLLAAILIAFIWRRRLAPKAV
jgi:hypothetical protein